MDAYLSVYTSTPDLACYLYLSSGVKILVCTQVGKLRIFVGSLSNRLLAVPDGIESLEWVSDRELEQAMDRLVPFLGEMCTKPCCQVMNLMVHSEPTFLRGQGLYRFTCCL